MNKTKLIENLFKYPLIYYALYFLYFIKPSVSLFSLTLDKINTLIHYILILWGIIIILYSMKDYKKYFKYKNTWINFIFSVCAVLTVLWNINMITFSSVKTVILTIFSMFLMLPAYRILREKYDKEEILKYIFYPQFYFKFILSIISILMYFFNISIYEIDEKNNLYYMGIRYVEILNGNYSPLLYGVYRDPNYASIMTLAILVVAAYIYVNYKTTMSKFNKIFFVLFFIIEYIFMTFNNSRGTLYSIYLILLFLIFLIFIKNIIYKKITFSKKYFKKILLVVGVIILVFSTWHTSQKIGVKISQITKSKSYISYITKDNKKVVENLDSFNNYDILDKDLRENFKNKSNSDADIKNKVTEEKKDSTEELGNGRLTIWKDTYKLYKKSIIFGFGPEMQKINGEKYNYLDIPSMEAGRAIHNSYFNLLLSFGAIGFIVIISWIGYLLINIMRKEMEYKGEFLFSKDMIVVVGILTLLTAYFFLDAVFVNIEFNQIYLMFIIGFLSMEYKIGE